LIGHNLFETTVFVLKTLEALEFTDGETRVLRLPVVVGGVAHPVLAAEISDFSSSLAFLQHGGDLFLGVSLGFHESSSVSSLYRETLSHGVAVFGSQNSLLTLTQKQSS